MLIRAYGVGCNIYFPLIDKGATDFEATPVTIATGDCKISKDGGAFANTNSNFAHLAGGIYSLALTATEMQAKNIVIKIVDQTATKEWEDQAIIIDTVNHASAEIPSLWAIVQSLVNNAITAAAINADAITAAKLASDVTTELQSGLATASALTTVGSNVSAIKTVTDALDPPTAAEIAEAVLTRDVSVEGDEDTATAQTLVGMILKLTSRFVASTGVTYKGDGTTAFMTQTPTTDVAADPVVELGVGA